AERIADYEMKYGKDEVEKFLDAVLSIQEHIDPSIISSRLSYEELEWMEEEEEKVVKQSPYDDLWSLDEKPKEKKPVGRKKERKFPPQPEKDILLFIQEYSRELEDWQRDILT
ncbi:SpoVR family protein, partial [Oceanobacillus caeni]